MPELKHLEVWADSFKEGEWFLDNVATQFRGKVDRAYRYNFQPVFTFLERGVPHFTATVYGDYRGWTPLPIKVKSVLEYGKPDIMLYDALAEKVFFAVEETAAVPTGNQSLQRLERVVFAAEQQIPFVYLISEYGLHRDGGVRRSSIWPSYLALKLSSQHRVPSLTLLYSDHSHPEDYSYGTGVKDLAVVSHLFIREWLGEDVKREKEGVFASIFKAMGIFISDQYGEISPYLPGRSLLLTDELRTFVAGRTAEYAP